MKTNVNFGSLSKLRFIVTTVILMLFAGSYGLAQQQFLWTGDAGTENWTDKANWDYYPLTVDGGGVVSPAPYYPGQVSGNPNAGKDDVALFSSASDTDCKIDKVIADGVCSALRIAGIQVIGYTHTISQVDKNRFIVAEAYSGVWDGSTLIDSDQAALAVFNGSPAYRAYFDFTGNFLGAAVAPIGCNPDYTMLFGVPFDLVNAGLFRAPAGELRLRHNVKFTSGVAFDAAGNTVVLSNRSSGLGTRTYEFPGVDFYDLKVTSNNGTGIVIKEFVNGDFTVNHDFMLTGLLGRLDGVGSHRIVLNGDATTRIHIKNDLIIANKFNGPSYTSNLAIGSLILELDGDGDQTITDLFNTHDYSGNLPALVIDKPTGEVYLDGTITVNNFIDFQRGIVHPATISSSQGNLTTSTGHFLLNSFATVSGASDLSFCDGPIKLRTGKSIVLPIGKGTTYRPTVINAVSGVSPAYSSLNTYYAEYFPAMPVVGVSNLETSLTEVSNCEVWAIQKIDVTDSYVLDLELSYDIPTGSCTDFLYDYDCQLVVSRWDETTSEWESHGGEAGMITGDATVGSTVDILTADFERSAVGRPDLFTFGHAVTDECDTCDVSVYANYCVENCIFTFEAIHNAGADFYTVDWNFGDGSSSDLVAVHEFGSTGIHTVSVTVCAITAGDTCCATYTFDVISNDCTPGATFVAPVVENGGRRAPAENLEEGLIQNENSLKIQPNPSYDGQVQIALTAAEQGSFDYMIVNGQGAVLQKGLVAANRLETIDTSDLAPGMYFITINLGNEKITERLMISK